MVLVRTRDDFAAHGFAVAVVDAPSDRKERKGMRGGFRNSAEHVTDIDAVTAHLKKTVRVPVWLIGTSRGTESAAYVAIHAKEKIAGVVLTSSMTEDNSAEQLSVAACRCPWRTAKSFGANGL